MKHYTDEILIDYLHGELPSAEDARLYAHLAVCDDCRGRHDAEASLGEMLRASARADERDFPSLIKAKVWVAIRDAEPTLFDRLRGFLRPAIAAPLVAMFVLFAYFGVPIVRGGAGAPSVGIAYYLDEHAAETQENPLSDHTSVNTTFALERSQASATAPLIDAADAATLDDDVSPVR